MGKEIQAIIATDCGSTTTKAILIEKVGNEYRQTFRGEAPTTVEAPFEDVTVGVLNSIKEIEELSGRKILDGDKIITPANGKVGVDAYISTSSAGGGLQMMVAGAVKTMTGESAQRAALGAGAIVMDILAINDKRLPHKKIERIRQLRPDMILLSGGTDGGTIKHVVELAEYIGAADPRPRLGMSYKLPVLYAGNIDAREEVKKILNEKMALVITDNLRPSLEKENLMPARLEIQTLFLEHVMAQAPGYKKLMEMASIEIMPTPAAVGQIMQTISRINKINVIGVDIGGATTDVFSVVGDVFNRTVSANYGMSYSISNVLADAGLKNVMRWLSFEVEEGEVGDRIKNKMIRPTTIPQSMEELKIEQAISREALRLSFDQHKVLAVGLKGVQQTRSIADALNQTATGQSIINMMGLDLIVGSGGVLSHAPRRNQSMSMMIDAFKPEGVTMLAVDSIFMMPHLGVLSNINQEIATEVFDKDCMVYLGTCIAPVGVAKEGAKVMDYKITMGGTTLSESITFGQMKMFNLGLGETAQVELNPCRNFDVGNGPGKSLAKEVKGGVVGLVVDARGRDLVIPENPEERKRKIKEWNQALNLYPEY
ncbi:MAG: methylaspartate mutase [Bdellovibrionales bacterium RIFOXYD12_FULL_39_22]|nr:MAG: methylaspartate mutase [Bdellovibrionales bacterium RIFOXYB1_FULL_39_21]OFZ41983.1 MAG: methylaspartate mutase [Bdellovibrionales bacterium RIFOXYC12_FULL_39_17]OFZ50699.1 MAG: methylaspartate mutase [Bdellovibrionales bacterium RIFOXYC1_FULL_39_130]OFZ76447.1 MAG: methylaspartate mutase [Bdellovibrionales bacterium RIFOXYC2_FULL_39_8]OFZ77922.1 MAG: methylaspartate mutase [Bdellovibrionales bacterium RIFOXYD1_FULL_39_84]OFZ93642.1 MAG: methylaspartate mutase [Bdellovibrionales bacteri